MKRIAILYHPKIDAARDFAEETAGFLSSLDASTGLCSAWDEEGARAYLDASPRHGEWVDYDAGEGDTVRAWVVYPERSDPAPVGVVTSKSKDPP